MSDDQGALLAFTKALFADPDSEPPAEVPDEPRAPSAPHDEIRDFTRGLFTHHDD